MMNEQIMRTRADVVEQQDALTLYLDALLREAGVGDPEVSVAEPVVAPVPAMPAPVVEAAVAPQPAGQHPDWAQGRFQCLCFTVAGLKLAAPLDRMHGILEWSDAITTLPGHAPWFLGLLPNRGVNVKVVDIAQVVMPENRALLEQKPARERASHVILIDGGRFGLACDALAEVVHLHVDDVRWRTDQTRRRWLAGTVVEHMCALLDMDHLVAELNKGGLPVA